MTFTFQDVRSQGALWRFVRSKEGQCVAHTQCRSPAASSVPCVGLVSIETSSETEPHGARCMHGDEKLMMLC